MALTPITWQLIQKAVYWAPGSLDVYGKTSFSEPVEIDCRWDENFEKMMDEVGEEFVSKAEVMTDRDCKVGGYLMLGELESGIPSDPEDEREAFMIRSKKNTPSVDGTEILYQRYL